MLLLFGELIEGHKKRMGFGDIIANRAVHVPHGVHTDHPTDMLLSCQGIPRLVRLICHSGRADSAQLHGKLPGKRVQNGSVPLLIMGDPDFLPRLRRQVPHIGFPGFLFQVLIDDDSLGIGVAQIPDILDAILLMPVIHGAFQTDPVQTVVNDGVDNGVLLTANLTILQNRFTFLENGFTFFAKNGFKFDE